MAGYLDFFDYQLDVIALIFFISCWFFYSFIADYRLFKGKNLVTVMHLHRRRWMKNMIKRSDRLVDSRIIESLSHATTFLASTSILIIAGFCGVLGYAQKGVDLINSLPFTVETSLTMWIIKSILVIFIFVYAFYKFTWVMRQFNYAQVILMSTPLYKEPMTRQDSKLALKYASKLAVLLSNAGWHFNIAVRSYYFGLAALSWYISPLVLIIVSVLLLIVLYRREFMSRTLDLLKR